MYLAGDWYKLVIRGELVREDDPIARLDVSLLADNLLAPVLGINDPRRDKRIEFIGGIRGLSELERRVDELGGVAVPVDERVVIGEIPVGIGDHAGWENQPAGRFIR